MSAVAIEIEARSLDAIVARLGGLPAELDESRLVDVAANVVESQTRRRILEDKAGPDGDPWADWSPAYAATRHGGQSLLQGRGDLLDSIFGEARGGTGVVGTNMIYGAVQQLGSRGEGGVPARPFLGISDPDFAELESVLGDLFRGMVQ